MNVTVDNIQGDANSIKITISSRTATLLRVTSYSAIVYFILLFKSIVVWFIAASHMIIDILFFHCSFVDMLNIILTCRDILCVDINVDKRCVDHSTSSYCGLLSFDILHLYKVIKSGNECHAGMDRRVFGIKQDFLPLFFFMYDQNL